MQEDENGNLRIDIDNMTYEVNKTPGAFLSIASDFSWTARINKSPILCGNLATAGTARAHWNCLHWIE